MAVSLVHSFCEGLKNADGSICYVIGVLKAIRQRLGKTDGDTVHVTIKLREA